MRVPRRGGVLAFRVATYDTEGAMAGGSGVDDDDDDDDDDADFSKLFFKTWLAHTLSFLRMHLGLWSFPAKQWVHSVDAASDGASVIGIRRVMNSPRVRVPHYLGTCRKNSQEEPKLTHIVDRCMLPKMLVELRNVGWVVGHENFPRFFFTTEKKVGDGVVFFVNLKVQGFLCDQLEAHNSLF